MCRGLACSGANAAACGHTGHRLAASRWIADGEKRRDEELPALSKPKLLIVDELGCRPLGPTRRTCSSSPPAAAILDRLLHHSRVPTIRGDSHRLRAKRRRGLIKAPPAGDGANLQPQP